jgi:hypothetical protein
VLLASHVLHGLGRGAHGQRDPVATHGRAARRHPRFTDGGGVVAEDGGGHCVDDPVTGEGGRLAVLGDGISELVELAGRQFRRRPAHRFHQRVVSRHRPLRLQEADAGVGEGLAQCAPL